VLAAIVTCASPVAAQETNSAMAEALYDTAIKLMEEGKNEEACPKLAQSQKLDPAVGTLLYLGVCYERMGKTASAWAAYRAAGEAGRKANQPERQKMAVERARNLEPQLSKLTIHAAPGDQTSGLQILLDGAPLGSAVLGVAMPVDPGTHTLEVSAPGKQPWTHPMQVPVGSPAITVTIPPLTLARRDHDAVTASGAKRAQGVPPSAPDMEPGSNTQRTLGIVAAGLGVAGLAVGTAYALKVQSSEEDAKNHCSNYPTGCDEIGLDKNAEARDASTWATVGFVAGGAALLGGALLYFTAPSDQPGPARASFHVQPGVAENEVGVLVYGAF
jgi:serine/threonine-protein kinase